MADPLSKQVFGIVYDILVIHAVNSGLGRDKRLLDERAIVMTSKVGAKAVNFRLRSADVMQTVYASDLFYVASIWLSRTSLLLLILRLSPERSHIWLTKAGLFASGIALLVGIVMIAVGCVGSTPLDTSLRSCHGTVGRPLPSGSLPMMLTLATVHPMGH